MDHVIARATRAVMDPNPEGFEVAAAVLLAPYLGSISPYIRMEACRILDHPQTPNGGCVCGAVKP